VGDIRRHCGLAIAESGLGGTFELGFTICGLFRVGEREAEYAEGNRGCGIDHGFPDHSDRTRKLSDDANRVKTVFNTVRLCFRIR
jgi:hypothetical protein